MDTLRPRISLALGLPVIIATANEPELRPPVLLPVLRFWTCFHSPERV